MLSHWRCWRADVDCREGWPCRGGEKGLGSREFDVSGLMFEVEMVVKVERVERVGRVEGERWRREV